jgi:hypothetical protein
MGAPAKGSRQDTSFSDRGRVADVLHHAEILTGLALRADAEVPPSCMRIGMAEQRLENRQ